VSEQVRDVCMSHQSDWIYYEQPIKFFVVKVNGMRETQGMYKHKVCINTRTLVIEKYRESACCRFVIFSPVWREV